MIETNATPHAELIAELMNPNNPKNEREHAAVREIERLQEALAQPEQEPVGRFAKFTDGIWREVTDGSAGVPLYTAPPPCPTCEALARTVMLDQTSHDTKRPWVGLTDEEANLLWENTDDRDSWELIKRVESKLKERNT